MKAKDVKYVDWRFTDPRGKWQHVTFAVEAMDEEALSEGLMFDGSSIAGWKVIHESDMKLKPDLDSIAIDPFFAQTTLSVVCDVLEPLTDEPYGRDPRSIARKSLAYDPPRPIRSNFATIQRQGPVVRPQERIIQ